MTIKIEIKIIMILKLLFLILSLSEILKQCPTSFSESDKRFMKDLLGEDIGQYILY